MAHALKSILDFLLSQVDPLLLSFVLTDKNRSGLKTIQFIEMPFVRNVADKVVYVCLFFLFSFVLLKDERFGSTEAVMQFSDGLTVTEYKPSIFRG
jgi:hypothetical protein